MLLAGRRLYLTGEIDRAAGRLALRQGYLIHRVRHVVMCCAGSTAVLRR
ncbi:MAG: hypothetical protein MZV63_50335 [Marinilabiliales bacterium]|nr:hypothetical protein [Marinilabiliales bacterium]